MKEYEVVIKVSMSGLVRVEAESREEAIEKAKGEYYDGKIMTDFNKSEFYDGITSVRVMDSES